MSNCYVLTNCSVKTEIPDEHGFVCLECPSSIKGDAKLVSKWKSSTRGKKRRFMINNSATGYL